MTAKQLYNKILSNIKGGYTIRVVINRARKHNMQDIFENISFYTGMTLEQAMEFMKGGRKQ